MNKSEKFWDWLSKKYDHKAKDETYTQILSRTEKYLNPDQIVLDFACATGLYSFEFAKSVKHIEAFDTSPKMIELARENANINSYENIAFSQTTLFDKKYHEGSFDVILALNILLYFDNPEAVLQRMKKLLKPNGMIITSTACLKERKSVAGTVAGIVIWLLTKLRIMPYLKFLRVDELEAMIRNSGYALVEAGILIEKPAVEYFVVARKTN